MDKVQVALTSQQVDLLRGVLFEYYSSHSYHDDSERDLHAELEVLLADAEDSF